MNSKHYKAWLFTSSSPVDIFSGYSAIDPDNDLLVAVDGGLDRMNALGLEPEIIIGDMDSVSASLLEEYSTTPQLTFPADKNETDTELAIRWCLEQGAREIVVCNDLGGRFDHAFALMQNIRFAFEQGLSCVVESHKQRAFFLDEANDLLNLQGCMLSLFAWDDKAKFRDSAGLQYPLKGITLSTSNARGISNLITSSAARISIASGKVLAILTK